MVLPGSLFHCLRHDPPAAEKSYLRAVGSSENQHVRVQVGMVSEWEVQVWLSVLATWVHGLRIAARRQLNLPHVGDLYLRYLGYEKGLFPGPMGQGHHRRAASSEGYS